MTNDEVVDGSFGAIDTTSLVAIQKVFFEEPLVDSAEFDDITNPRELIISLSDGVDSPGKFTIKWSINGNYSIHYSEAEVDFRFDHHPNPHSPMKHFHPPPDASREGAEESCIGVELDELVARGVLKAWRRWYESGGEVNPNEGDLP